MTAKDLALRRRYRVERLMMALVALGTLLAFLILFLVVAYALLQGASALTWTSSLRTCAPQEKREGACGRPSWAPSSWMA